MKLSRLILIGCLFVGGCTFGFAARSNCVPLEGCSVGGHGAPGFRAVVPTVAIAYRGETLLHQTSAFGVLLLQKSGKNSLQTCRALFGSFGATQDETSSSISVSRRTFWLDRRTRRQAPPSDNKNLDCRARVFYYDYVRAAGLLSQLGMLESAGPVLVGFAPADSGNGDLLVFDVSRFANADLERAMRIWGARIVKDPDLWKKGWRLVMAREHLRNLTEKYGQHIVQVVAGGRALAQETP